ncbi:Zinc finger protein ZPR1 [Hypsibius exemplaris]|uniref:Zinc finger protein ZPR1 n=1 Tax=Hypsibius exemplaris TaxID=2072580 RepID=A0A1W0X4V2_HYPEX|nr:Zinc finger protein ZPR1 [Hypsibius exemplaris]
MAAETSTTSRQNASVSFPNISGDNPEVTEIESLCVACGRNGTTRLLMVKIPFYKEVIVSSFSCDHCGYSDTASMAGQKIQEEGVEHSLLVTDEKDLNRTVVMSDVAAVRIPELEFEAPYGRQSFGITTVEGVITRAKDLLQKYVVARTPGEEGMDKINQFVEQLDLYLALKKPFHLVIDDPSGNCFVENLHAPSVDPALTVRTYQRTPDMDALCGFERPPAEEVNESGEVMVFPATCFVCGAGCQTNMKTVDVPHFKEILIMSTVCDKCGWKNNEAKPASGIEDEGVEIDLHVTGKDDLNRDVIKSSTCALRIPELDFDMLASDHSSRYSTVEGLISNIKDELVTNNPFVQGDSSDSGKTDKLRDFGLILDEVMAGNRQIHFILNDPAGNSFIQKLEDPDTNLQIHRFKRTPEQDDDLCITDMKTVNYD